MSVSAFGLFTLDPATRELRKSGTLVALPPRAFACLALLLEHRDRALPRDELIETLWNGRGATDVQLAQLILQCRRAVDDDGQAQRVIRTVAGFGYRWAAELRQAGVETSASPLPPVEPRDAAVDPIVAEPPHVPSARRRRSGIIFVCVLALVLAASIALWRSMQTRIVLPVVERVLVTPLRIDDSDAGWLRLGGLDVVVERLRHHQVPVLSSETSVALLQKFATDASSSIDSIAPLQLRAAAEASAVVQLAAHRDGADWIAEAVLTRSNAPSLQTSERSADPIAALRALADRISAALGHPVAEPGVAPGSDAVATTLQQARAELLANQPQRARELLLANPALVHDEPLLRQQLADVDIRAGRYAEARTALDALLATPGLDAAFHAQLLNARGMVSVRGGRFAEAGTDFSAAIDLLGAHGDALALGRAYSGRGVSRTSLQDYAGALADDAQARAAYERSGDLGSVARVDSNIGALEILRGHMAQAETYLQPALARFRDIGFVQERVNTLQLLYVAARSQLKRAAAASAIDEDWSLRARIVSPSSQWSVGLYRVDWLLWNGRLSEAAALLDTLASSAHPAAAAEGERLHLMRASLARAAGRRADALEELALVPDDVAASADDDSVRAEVSLLRARLERESGRAADAAAPAHPASDIALPATPRTPLRLLAAANRAIARADAPAAEAAFNAAQALADEQGVPATIAAIAIDHAQYLLANGRKDEANVVAARIAPWADNDFECALLQLRVAHALGAAAAWSIRLEQAQRLAGERVLPPELGVRPR